MTELQVYHQYQCPECGFRTRSPDEDETIDITQRHHRQYHDSSPDREAIRDDLRLLELEGLPENA